MLLVELPDLGDRLPASQPAFIFLLSFNYHFLVATQHGSHPDWRYGTRNKTGGKKSFFIEN